MSQERVYPIPTPTHDARFTFGLLADTVRVLEEHGYPRPTTGPDLIALQQALFGFLYAQPDSTTPPAGSTRRHGSTDQSSAVPPVSPRQSHQQRQGETPIMLRHNTSGEDAVRNATHKADITARQAKAKAADSARRRASHAAGTDRRSIGVTRREG